MTIYEAMYEIVEHNMAKSRKPFEYHKETFLCEVNTRPGRIDLRRYLLLSNADFLQAITVAALRRLPEPKALDYWANQMNQPREVFQAHVLRRLANSSTAAIHHIEFENNPYFTDKKSLKTRLLGLTGRLTDMTVLRSIGKKCPKPLRRILRKAFQ